MLTSRHISSEGHLSTNRGVRGNSPLYVWRWMGRCNFPGWGALRDMWRGGWMPPETPAPFGVLLAQDLFFTFTFLLGAQVAILFLQEPHRWPALLLKVPLVFCREQSKKKKGMKRKSHCRKKQHENSLCHFKMCADGMKEWSRSPFLNKWTLFHLIGFIYSVRK